MIKGRPSPRPRFYRGKTIFPRPRSGGQFFGLPRPRLKIKLLFLGLSEILKILPRIRPRFFLQFPYGTFRNMTKFIIMRIGVLLAKVEVKRLISN